MSKNKYFTFSNFLSFIRLLLIVPVWIFMDRFPDQTFRNLVAASGIFAALTDVMDGYFARKFNSVTEAGKIIDPLADKILVGFVIVKLFMMGEIPLFYFVLIIGRDLLILAGGLFIAAKTKFVLPSDKWGKAAVISVSLVLLLILINADRTSIYFNLLFFLSIGLIIISFSNYAVKAFKTLTEKLP